MSLCAPRNDKTKVGTNCSDHKQQWWQRVQVIGKTDEEGKDLILLVVP